MPFRAVKILIIVTLWLVTALQLSPAKAWAVGFGITDGQSLPWGYIYLNDPFNPDDKEHRLFSAVEDGNLASARSLLDQGADPDYPLRGGARFIHMAVDANRPELVQLLLERKAELDQRMRPGSLTPLMLALNRGRWPLAQMLLQAGANPDIVDGEGESALSFSLKKARWDFARMVAEKASRVNIHLNAERETPLHLAARKARLDLLRTLLDEGGNVFARMADGRTPLHDAVLGGSVPAARLLLERAANPVARDNQGRTPYDLAKQAGLSELQNLLETPATPEVPPTPVIGRTSTIVITTSRPGYGNLRGADRELFEAVNRRSSILLERAVEAGAKPNARGEQGQTPLHMAAHSNTGRLVGPLVAAGASLDAQDQRGETPLATAVRLGAGDAAGAMILQGAEWPTSYQPRNPQPNAMASLLRNAREGNSGGVMGAVLAGAKLEAAPGVMLDAVLSGDTNTVRLLLALGAPQDITDAEGRTAAALAEARGLDEVAETLKRSSHAETAKPQREDKEE